MTRGHGLPIPAERIIPHRPPMRLVGTLLSMEGVGGVTESVLPPGTIMADERDTIDEVALVELIAQSYASVKGYLDLQEGKPPGKGFLVGIRRLRIDGTARVGDRLLTTIRTVSGFAGFAVVEGTIRRGEEIIASGTIKLWLAGQGTDPGENR